MHKAGGKIAGKKRYLLKYRMIKPYTSVTTVNMNEIPVILKPMIKCFSILFLIQGFCCQAQKSILRDHLTVDVYTYESENKTKAAAMPALKKKVN